MKFNTGIGKSVGCARLQVVGGKNSAVLTRQGQFLTLTLGTNLDREEQRRFSTKTVEMGNVRLAKEHMARMADLINADNKPENLTLPAA